MRANITFVALSLLAVLALPVVADAVGNEVYFSPNYSNASNFNPINVQIWARMEDPFQAGQIAFTYNSSCITITNWERNVTNFAFGVWNSTVDGEERIGFVGTTLMTGEYLIGTLTVHCISEDECSTPLDFVTTGKQPAKLFNDFGDEITEVSWKSSILVCGSHSLPILTTPTSKPAAIETPPATATATLRPEEEGKRASSYLDLGVKIGIVLVGLLAVAYLFIIRVRKR
jgi:hypothetical protein